MDGQSVRFNDGLTKVRWAAVRDCAGHSYSTCDGRPDASDSRLAITICARADAHARVVAACPILVQRRRHREQGRSELYWCLRLGDWGLGLWPLGDWEEYAVRTYWGEPGSESERTWLQTLVLGLTGFHQEDALIGRTRVGLSNGTAYGNVYSSVFGLLSVRHAGAAD